VPRRRIQKAFRSFLVEKSSRLAVAICLGRRTDELWEFTFDGVNGAIRGALTAYEIEVMATFRREPWGLLLNLDAEPKRCAAGYVCAACNEEKRRTFASREALWADHLFEPLLEWVNETLGVAKWLALFGDPHFATWARFLASDDPASALGGGGLTLNFAWISGGRLRNQPDESPPILLPCRTR
jgi:hypothetical protein